MPYRTFQDSGNTEWQVWDVVPRLNERRAIETDRRVDITPIAFADRRREERRLSNDLRSVLRGSYSRGWLCFDNGHDKKRLSPIPDDWTVCDRHTMEAYLRAADAVRTSRIFGRGSDESLAEAG